MEESFANAHMRRQSVAIKVCVRASADCNSSYFVLHFITRCGQLLTKCPTVYITGHAYLFKQNSHAVGLLKLQRA